MNPDFARFRYLTFDCYGTLIDWEAGLLRAMRALVAAHGLVAEDDALLALHARLEPAAQAGAFRPYREVLREVVRGVGREFGFRPTAEEERGLEESIAFWPPFPDTIEALTRLSARFRLVVLSNVDEDLFAGSARALGVPFDAVFTAEAIGSYKPDPRNFSYAIERLGGARDAILHVAQSRYHDIAPARAAGLATVWVRRRSSDDGSGATPASGARADIEVPDLAALADLVG